MIERICGVESLPVAMVPTTAARWNADYGMFLCVFRVGDTVCAVVPVDLGLTGSQLRKVYQILEH